MEMHTLISAEERHDFVTATIAGQLFGIPVLQVNDVLAPQRVTRVPLAPAEVAGSLNLRGRIVTVIDLRTRLGLPKSDKGVQERMSIVVDQRGELYSLLVDTVGEVMNLEHSRFERHPPTLDAAWRDASTGIYRLDKQLMVVLDVNRLLKIEVSET